MKIYLHSPLNRYDTEQTLLLEKKIKKKIIYKMMKGTQVPDSCIIRY